MDGLDVTAPTRSFSSETPVRVETVRTDRASDPIATILNQNLSFPEARRALMAEFERRYVDHALRRSNGHVGRAAQSAGIAGRYFRQIKARARRTASL